MFRDCTFIIVATTSPTGHWIKNHLKNSHQWTWSIFTNTSAHSSPLSVCFVLEIHTGRHLSWMVTIHLNTSNLNGNVNIVKLKTDHTWGMGYLQPIFLIKVLARYLSTQRVLLNITLLNKWCTNHYYFQLCILSIIMQTHWFIILTQYCLMMPYGDIDQGQYWFRKWFITWWHQTMKLINVALSPNVVL